MTKLFEWICGTSSAIAAIISPDSVIGFLADLLEETTTRLARNGPWEKGISAGALEQLLFDLQFLESAAAPILTDTAKGDLAKCADLATRAARGRKERKETAAKEKKEYAAQIARVIAQLKSQNVSLELPTAQQ